jgi:hypothetical protein
MSTMDNKNLDEIAICQLWIIKIWMKKPNLYENNNKIRKKCILHP